MTKRMLIDATQQEETRVVLTDGNRVEDFDFEVADRKNLKGNVYLAKVVRVEPSLQAAFIEYGGNRHGFLAFNEIHPDYYRIPIEDRQALLEIQAQAERGLEDEMDELPDDGDDDVGLEDADAGEGPGAESTPDLDDDKAGQAQDEDGNDARQLVDAGESEPHARPRRGRRRAKTGEATGQEASSRSVGARRYKIQEVIARRQVLLVQVVSEERGNKGAALSTYLSLAGRYCVLMPNTPRGGGVSRKITDVADRKRLKGVVDGLDVPSGMAIIVRTAGSLRTKTEIKRDYEYLLRLWEQLRELTLESSAPCLVHEEANLIRRSIRDLYARDIEEILVEGDDGYKTAKTFMKTLMPSHARRVRRFSNGGIPLFHHFQVDSQLDAMYTSTVQLRSGGYIVLNQTEALVAIDVNSGRSTRERNIEETALKTNLEAATEIARQLRLRDLAGLIVIDFIDMDGPRNQHAVERRLKEELKTDRARVHLGRISQFGLLEMSRQRIRPSVAEASTTPCSHCEGTGRVRSTDSAALQVLRSIEEEGIKQQASELSVYLPSAIGFYVFNHKRDALASMEERYVLKVHLKPDDSLIAPEHRIERVQPKRAEDRNTALQAIGIEARVDDGPPDDEAGPSPAETDAEGSKPRRRRKRSDRRRGGAADPLPAEVEAPEEAAAAGVAGPPAGDDSSSEDDGKSRRRRGRRGGRRRIRRGAADDPEVAGSGEDSASTVSEPAASGPSEAPVVVTDEIQGALPAEAVGDNTLAEAAAAETTDVTASGEAVADMAAGVDEPDDPADKPRKKPVRPRRRKAALVESQDDAAPALNVGSGAAEAATPSDRVQLVAPEILSSDLIVSAPLPELLAREEAVAVAGVTEDRMPNGGDDMLPSDTTTDRAPRAGWWNRPPA